MAIENAKTLNTRIILKNDTLAKWNDSSLILESGEVAFARVESADNYGTPTYLMKVGDGTNTFADLKWVAANAADVYSWAKSKEIKTAGTGNGVTSVSVVNNEDGTTSVVLNKELTFALASDLNNYTTTEALIELLDEYITEDELTTVLAGYALKEHTHTVSEITDFDTEVKKYDYATKTEAQGYADAKDEAIAAAQEAADNAQDDVDALAAKVGTVADDTTVVEMIAAAQEAATYDDTALKARVEANEGAIATLNGSGDGSVNKKITDAINDFATKVTGDNNTYDTFKELVEYVAEHGGEAADMAAAITILENIVDGIGGEGEKGTVVEYVTDAIAALKIEDYAKAADLLELAGRVTTVEGKVSTLEGKVATWDAAEQNAKDYTDEEITKLTNGAIKDNADAIDAINDTLDTYGDIVTHNASEFATVGELAATNEEVAKKANDADLAAIAKSGSTDDLVQGESVLVFNCGTSGGWL